MRKLCAASLLNANGMRSLLSAPGVCGVVLLLGVLALIKSQLLLPFLPSGVISALLSKLNLSLREDQLACCINWSKAGGADKTDKNESASQPRSWAA
eukprot:1779666-Amphidinium_carterae.1